MSPTKRYAKKQAKARQRRRRTVQERLARDRRRAQYAAKVVEQALQDLCLPDNLVDEIEGRLRSQHTLLGKIFGMMCPPLQTGPEDHLRQRGLKTTVSDWCTF
jgi:hypothetical protein